MGYHFEAKYSKHTEGTKFYQVFRITNSSNGHGVVVTHWGSIRTGTEWPKDHGQHKTASGNTSGVVAELYSDAIKKKRARGYTSWNHSISPCYYADERGLQDALSRYFDDSLIIKCMKALRDDTEEVDDDREEVEIPEDRDARLKAAAERERQKAEEEAKAEIERRAYREEQARKERERLEKEEQERQDALAARAADDKWGSW